MAKISIYPIIAAPILNDTVIGTDIAGSNSTKNFLLADIITLATTTGQFVTKIGVTLPTYANNAAAISGGLAINSIYKTSTGEVRIVV
jgi:hypothetical protein